MKTKLSKNATVDPDQEEKAFRKKLFDDVTKVLDCRLLCTCCLKDVKNYALVKSKAYIHPFFQVLICKDCLKFYGDGYISPDEDGSDKYCRWCGQGGCLYVCSDCPVAICKVCVHRNMNRTIRREVEKDDWKCFSCEPKPLFELRAQAWALKSWLKSLKSTKKDGKEKVDKPVDTSLQGQLKAGLEYEITLMKEIGRAQRSSEMKFGGICRRKELTNPTDLTIEKIVNVSKEIRDNLKQSISKLMEFDKHLDSYVTSLCERVKNIENEPAATVMEIDGSSNDEEISEEVNKRTTKENNNIDKSLKRSSNDSTSVNAEVICDSESGDERVDSLTNGINGEDVDELFPDDDTHSKDTVESCAVNKDQSEPSDEVVQDGIEREDGVECKTENAIPKLTLRIRKVDEVNKALQSDNTNAQKSEQVYEIIDLEDDNEPPSNVSNKNVSVNQEEVTSSLNGPTDENDQVPTVESQNNSDDEEKIRSGSQVKPLNEKGKSKNKKGSKTKEVQSNTAEKSSINVDTPKKTLPDRKLSSNKDVKEKSNENRSNTSGDIFSDDDVVETQVISSTSSENSSDEASAVKREKKLRKSRGAGRTPSKKNDEVHRSDDSSETDSDLERVLNMKYLNVPKKKPVSKERVKKERVKSEKEKEETSLLDYSDDDSSDCSVGELRDQLAAIRDMKPIDALSIYRHIKSKENLKCLEPLASSNESEAGDLAPSSSDDDVDELIDSDEEKKGKQKIKKKKKDEEVEEISSDESEENAKSSKRKKDKLLSLKISDDSDSDDIFQKKNVNKKAEKRPKKKINVISDSDEEDMKKKKKNSSESSDSDISEDDTPKRKRKRIKKNTSSSDENGGVEDSGGKGHRKNIRKVLKKDSLHETTLNAVKEEENRKKRIAERQKLYNQMLEECELLSSKVDKLVLDFNIETKEELLSVDKDLVAKLKPHQAEGIKFMWDSCFETVKKAKKSKGSGCILAHCMGLGKTLQVIALLHTILTNDVGVKCALVLCPLSTVLNWASEFEKWLSDVGSGQDVDVFHMSKVNAQYRMNQLREWQRRGGVMILPYTLFRLLVNPTKRIKASHKAAFLETLSDPGPDIVICDEGHLLKNEKSAISKAVETIKCLRRIVLTGTPLQNNLIEYHCMMKFVKPNLLGTKKEFTNRFVNPIENGQFVDSTPHDVKVMKRRAHVLHKMLDGVVQRKAYNVLIPFLPSKHEYVLNLSLTEVQVQLYQHYLDNMARNKCETGVGTSLFKDRNMLSLICAHPRLLLVHHENELMKKEFDENTDEDEGSIKDFIDDGSDSESSSSSESSDSNSNSSASVKMVSRRKTRNAPGKSGSESDHNEEPEKDDNWWSEYIKGDEMDEITSSSKLHLFFTILQKCEEIGDKLLLFSQSLLVLDIIEYFLEKVDSQSQTEEVLPGLANFSGSWARGIDYFRLDGKTSSENRLNWCQRFNREDNLRARLFLISTRAGGLGINLTGANRVILFDASWNPSHDVQSIFRVYRFGQNKPCYIYRFLNKGTMEQKVYDRQVTKLSMSCRVIDEQQIDRHFSFADLNELYSFTPNERDNETPPLPKDRMLAELLQEHKDLVLGYHTHDSLLENQLDEELNEEERKLAWADFENEKNPPVNDMLNNYAETYQRVYKVLREKYPFWSEQEVRQSVHTVISKMNAISGGSVIQGYQQQLGQQQFMMQQQYRNMAPRMGGMPVQAQLLQPVVQRQPVPPRMLNNKTYLNNQGIVNKMYQGLQTQQPVNNRPTSQLPNANYPNLLPNPYAVGSTQLLNPFSNQNFMALLQDSAQKKAAETAAAAAATAAAGAVQQPAPTTSTNNSEQ